MKSPVFSAFAAFQRWANPSALLCSLGLLFSSPLLPSALAQAAEARAPQYPPNIPEAQAETYRQVAGCDLKLWIFRSNDSPSSEAPKPAIVFFFGGGWVGGTPLQFVSQAKALAARGMVACVADYRVATRNKAKPFECVSDAKACIRWVRSNAQRLGIDPQRIVAAGGSAGGHLAASTALLPGLDPDSEGKTVSCVPNALVLFNPGLTMAPLPGVELSGFLANATSERFGCLPEEISPAHHIRPGLPPTLIHHGTADVTVPYKTVEHFTELMKKAGNACELIGYEGQPHSFFNRSPYREETLQKTDAFLVSIGYLSPSVR